MSAVLNYNRANEVLILRLLAEVYLLFRSDQLGRARVAGAQTVCRVRRVGVARLRRFRNRLVMAAPGLGRQPEGCLERSEAAGRSCCWLAQEKRWCSTSLGSRVAPSKPRPMRPAQEGRRTVLCSSVSSRHKFSIKKYAVCNVATLGAQASLPAVSRATTSRQGCLRSQVQGCSFASSSTLSVTTVAPHPPASAGASRKSTTLGVRERIDRTSSRCTPIPLP